MSYQPTQFDLNWTRSLIDKMSDGGVWWIPRCDTIWRFDKTNRVLICVSGDWNAPDSKALRIICPILGWTTAHRPEALTAEQIEEAHVTTTTITAQMVGGGKSVSRLITTETA